MSLVKRGSKGSPVSATEYDGVVTQVLANESKSLANEVAIGSISQGTGVSKATRAAAMATNPLPLKGIPFVVFNEVGHNGQYRYNSDAIDGYDLIYLFLVVDATAVNGSSNPVSSNDLFDKNKVLQDNIDAEETARASADTTLQNNINAKLNQGSYVGNAANLKASIDDKLPRGTYTGGGSDLDSRISANLNFINAINNLLTSDDVDLNQLQELVDFIKQNKDDLDDLTISNISGLVDALDSIRQNFASADTTLQSNISAEETARILADSKLRTKGEFTYHAVQNTILVLDVALRGRFTAFFSNDPITVTINSDSFPANGNIGYIDQSGNGVITFVAGAGVTLQKHASVQLVSDGIYSTVSVMKVGADNYRLSGHLKQEEF